MSDRVRGFLGEILQRHFGPEYASSPRMRRSDVEKLLTDDGQRRLKLAERMAAEWGRAETGGDVEITSERFVITPRGMLYVAGLTGSRHASPRRAWRRFDQPVDVTGQSREASHHSLYYLATPSPSFDSIVDRVRATPVPRDSPAAVDSRFGHDLEFRWPLDTRLRRTLDSHQVLIWI